MRVIDRCFALALVALPLAAMAQQADQFAPGRWEDRIQFTGLSIGGAAQQVEALNASAKPRYSCVTPEMARAPALYFMGHQPGDNCTTPEGSVANGTISLKSICSLKGAPLTVSVRGRYDALTYHTDVTAEGLLPRGTLSMTMTADGKMVGACRGDETG